jgi:hypothetical protein
VPSVRGWLLLEGESRSREIGKMHDGKSGGSALIAGQLFASRPANGVCVTPVSATPVAQAWHDMTEASRDSSLSFKREEDQLQQLCLPLSFTVCEARGY